MPSPNPNLAAAARALEALPAGPSNAYATVSTALLKTLVRVGQLEEQAAGLGARLRVLERERAQASGRNEFVISPRSPGRPRV